MEVQVKLFNLLRRYAQSDRADFPVRVPTGAAVADLLKQLMIPTTVQRTILINGRRVDETARLSPGDTVVLMSPIEGG